MQNILFGTSCDSRNDHRYGIFLHFCLPSTEVLITLLKFFFYYLATKDCELGMQLGTYGYIYRTVCPDISTMYIFYDKSLELSFEEPDPEICPNLDPDPSLFTQLHYTFGNKCEKYFLVYR